MNCKHEKWLYVPTNVGIGDGKLKIGNCNFLCPSCENWIGVGSISPVEKIINVKHLAKHNCLHDIKYYTLRSTYICLRCGHEWVPELSTKLDIKTNINWEENDREERQKILKEYNDGKELSV